MEYEDGTFVVVGKMPAPIPWEDLEEACATSTLWRDAATEVRRHTEHWVVTLSTEAEPIDAASLLIRATAAAMEACPAAIGVYWNNAQMLVPRELFLRFTREILPKGPPHYLWVNTRVGQDSPTTTAGFTRGLAALELMEIETQGSPETVPGLRERLLAMASYLLENGLVIQDGDTVGEDANERVRVVYAPSAFGAEGEVMRLVYEKA